MCAMVACVYVGIVASRQPLHRAGIFDSIARLACSIGQGPNTLAGTKAYFAGGRGVSDAATQIFLSALAIATKRACPADRRGLIGTRVFSIVFNVVHMMSLLLHERRLFFFFVEP